MSFPGVHARNPRDFWGQYLTYQGAILKPRGRSWRAPTFTIAYKLPIGGSITASSEVSAGPVIREKIRSLNIGDRFKFEFDGRGIRNIVIAREEL